MRGTGQRGDNASGPNLGWAVLSRLLSSRTRLQTNQSGSQPPLLLDTPTEELPGFLPDKAPRSELAEEGWHFLAGPPAASPAPGRWGHALTHRHQMLFLAAPSSAHSFRFSTDGSVGNRGGGGADVTSPQPQAEMVEPGGQVGTSRQTGIEAGRRGCLGQG